MLRILFRVDAREPLGDNCERSEEHTSELQSHLNLVCRLLLEKKKHKSNIKRITTTRICNGPIGHENRRLVVIDVHISHQTLLSRDFIESNVALQQLPPLALPH